MEANQAADFLQPQFLAKLEKLRLIAKRVPWRGGEGEHHTPRVGFSLEFSDYRNYHAGADLRYVDWNAYRRLDRLFLKVFSAEEDLNIYLLVDTSLSMAEGAPSKLGYAKRVGAALGYIGLKNLDRVGAAAFADGAAARLALARGRKQILALFKFLGGLRCSGRTDLRAAARDFARHFSQQGLVVLLSDLLDRAGVEGLIDELVLRRYQLLVIHILDKAEMELPAAGAAAVEDVETGAQRNVFLDAELARLFREELARYLDEAESYCARRGADYFRTTTDVPFEDLVLLYLRQRRSIA
ncbi:MAG TPA: DUF58 domain-containing protein [Candidatus Acidoferrales bacterium]|nr:DUF58 domain-containing protein [Candidatus Acidoferrales bacterium]